jgi:hypothetical protein
MTMELNLPDARTRLLLALEDHSTGWSKTALQYQQGLLTPKDLLARRAFLDLRLNLARIDFVNDRRGRIN